MSKTKTKRRPHAAQAKAEEPPSQPSAKHSGTQRWVLIGLAIFLLLIFSVTGPMAQTIGSLIQGGPKDYATLDLPRGKDTISVEDFQSAQRLMVWKQNIEGRRGNSTQEEVIAFATLVKLADALQVEITTAELAERVALFWQFLGIQNRTQYRTFYRSLGARSAVHFEGVLAALMRVENVGNLLGEAAVPTTAEVLERWAKDYEEIRVEYATFTAEEYAAAAAELEPEEEELTAFFENDLNPLQRRELEREEAVSFEAVLLSADALQTAVVQEWAGAEPPTEADLSGFYLFNRSRLYLREDSEEPAGAESPGGGEEPGEPEEAEQEPVVKEPWLSQEEVGERLERDFLLHRSAGQLTQSIAAEDDARVRAAELGVEYLVFEEPVSVSELEELERVGIPDLRRLQRQELKTWIPDPFFAADGTAFVVRPLAVREREMPPLEEIRGQVADFWREKRQGELADEAAQAFVDGFPRGEDFIDGDPVILESREFGAAIAAGDKVVEVLDWVSKRSRPATDPKWSRDDRIRPWLRLQVGNQLDDYLVGQVIGPIENLGAKTWVVARLDGRRLADTAEIWPGEVEAARSAAANAVGQEFVSEGLSYEGLSRAYNIELIPFDTQ